MCFISITTPSVWWGTLNASLLCRNTNIELKLWGGGANEHSNQPGSSIYNYTVQERVSKNYNFKVKTVILDAYICTNSTECMMHLQLYCKGKSFKVKTVHRYFASIYVRTVNCMMQVHYKGGLTHFEIREESGFDHAFLSPHPPSTSDQQTIK